MRKGQEQAHRRADHLALTCMPSSCYSSPHVVLSSPSLLRSIHTLLNENSHAISIASHHHSPLPSSPLLFPPLSSSLPHLSPPHHPNPLTTLSLTLITLITPTTLNKLIHLQEVSSPAPAPAPPPPPPPPLLRL